VLIATKLVEKASVCETKQTPLGKEIIKNQSHDLAEVIGTTDYTPYVFGDCKIKICL
jgi:hypothetical protein